MTPSENSSNHDHHQVDQEDAKPAISNATLNVGNIAGDDASTEVDVERNGEAVMNIAEEVLENSGGNGTTVKPAVPSHEDHKFRLHKLRKISQAFLTQLAPVFVGYVIGTSSCSCLCSCSSLHSHVSCSCMCSQSQTSEHSWIKVTVIVAILVGIVANLISNFWTNIKDTFSSPTAKFGFGAVITGVIIAIGTTLPVDPKAKIPVTVVALLPVLVAIVRA